MRKALKELTSCQQHWVTPGWCRTPTFIMDEWVAKVTKRFQPNIHQRDAHVIGVQGSMLHEPVCLRMGEGVAKWSSARLVIDRSQILVQAGECSPRSTFWADSYFGSIRSTPVLQQQHVKGPCHSAKGASGRLQLNTHMWLWIKWHYKLHCYAHRMHLWWQQFHVAAVMSQLNSTVTISVDIQNALCKATVTRSVAHD